MTRLVSEARALVREALAVIDELPVELELQDVERCLYGVDERLVAIGHSRRNGGSAG